MSTEMVSRRNRSSHYAECVFYWFGSDVDEPASPDVSEFPDRDFLGFIYQRYKDALYRVCLFRLKDQSAAEDAVHDVFLKALLSFDKLNKERPAWPWLLTVAKRVCIDAQRRSEHSLCTNEMESLVHSCRTDDSDPTFDSVWMQQQVTRVDSLLNRLPSRQRYALLLHGLDKWSHREIGLASGISEGAAKQLVVRARKVLRKLARD